MIITLSKNSLVTHIIEKETLSNQVKRLATALTNCQNQGVKDIQELEAKYIKEKQEFEAINIKQKQELEVKYIKQKKESEATITKYKDAIIILKANNGRVEKDLRSRLTKLEQDRKVEVRKLNSQIEEDKKNYDRAMARQKKSYDQQLSQLCEYNKIYSAKIDKLRKERQIALVQNLEINLITRSCTHTLLKALMSILTHQYL